MAKGDHEPCCRPGYHTLPPKICPARERGAEADVCFSLFLVHVYLLHYSAVHERRAVTAPVVLENGVAAEAVRGGKEQRYPGQKQQPAEWTRVSLDQDAELRGDIFSPKEVWPTGRGTNKRALHLAIETC